MKCGNSILPQRGRPAFLFTEPHLVTREYLSPWARPRLDRMELAYLRKVEKWTFTRLRKHYRVGQETINRVLNRKKESLYPSFKKST